MRCTIVRLGYRVAFLAVAGLLPGLTAAHADERYETTVAPLGQATVESGAHDASYRLPAGPEGPLPQALVLIAAQPKMEEPPPSAASEPADDAAPQKPREARKTKPTEEQVAATLKMTVAGQQLPAWQLQEHPTGYVINLQTLRKNPQYQSGRIAMNIEMVSAAPTLDMVVVGMPDPLLAGDAVDGPLEEIVNSAADPEVKAYLAALVLEIAGQNETARAEYEKLRGVKNELVARLARRGLRMLSFELRQRKLSGNVMEHYRWGLYLQQCGLFSAAFGEYEECRIIDPLHVGSQYRAGETLDRQAGNLVRVRRYMEAGVEPLPDDEVVDWYVLLAILKSRQGKALTSEEIARIQDNWVYVQNMVQAAARGRIRIWTSAYQIEDEQRQAYVTYGPGAVGPAEDIVQARGWFDGVISVRPRLADEPAAAAVTVGGDEGPNGAALSALFHDATWPEYLKAWNQQLSWAFSVGEAGIRPPLLQDAVACGDQPIPYEGYGLRAALRYHVPPKAVRRVKIADMPATGDYLQLWRVEGPYAIKDEPPASGLPSHHVMEALPAGSAAKAIDLVSEHDFVNLAEVFPDAGWALARATCWVYSPADQEVRLWLGQNDGAAIWLNGRCIHQGRYYSAGKYEDANLVDTVAASADLKRGWNALRVVVESWPAPRDKGWGFSVRLCTWDNKPLPGLASVLEPPETDLVPAYVPPQPGQYYAWARVKDDWLDSLPRLSAAELQAITGVQGLGVTASIRRDQGCVAIVAPGLAQSQTYRPLSGSWDPAKDRDVTLNNVMDWSRESVAALRYTKEGKPHDLLFLRPEAIEAYLLLLNEPPAASGVFGKLRPSERVLGYVVVPAETAEFALLAVDTLLAEGSTWPLEEEDLLTPLSSEYIPNRSRQRMGPRP